jgi:uncharacterized protein (DUF302 family)
MTYGISSITTMTYEQAVEKVTNELKKEGFGILTTIDVKDTLKKKIGVDFKRYVILGACNPTYAHKSLQVEEEIGLFLPCNVIVYEKDNKTVVAAFDPMTLTTIVNNPHLEPIAKEVRSKLERVIAAL